MAITVGATKSSGSVGNTGSPLTVSHTVDGGSDYLIVVTSIYSGTAGRTVTGVTWDGVAMTLLTSQRSGSNLWGVYIWGIANPGVKTANVIASVSGIGSYFNIIAVNYTGVASVGNSNGATSASAASLSTDVSTDTSDMVVGGGVVYSTSTETSGNTSDGVATNSGAAFQYTASHQQASSATTTISWSGGTALRIVVGVALKDSGGGGGANPIWIL